MWVASCTSGSAMERPPAGPMMTLGGRLNLNDAAAEELALIPGIGPMLAGALAKARSERGGFRSWEEVDAVSGVGPAKLSILKQWTELRPGRGAAK
jgi:competence protein ComEA